MRLTGRPNVGVHTGQPHILGQKLAITSRKPQPLGSICRINRSVQAVCGYRACILEGQTVLNRFMNRSALTVLKDVDVAIFVVDRMLD